MAKRRRRSHKRAEEPKKRRRRHHRRSEARENPKSETGSLLIAGLVGVAAGAAAFWAFTTTQTYQNMYMNQLASGSGTTVSPSS